MQVYSAGTKPGTAVNDLSAQALAEVGVDVQETHPHSLIRSSFVTSTSWSPHVKPASTPCPAPGSRIGTPTNPPNAASTASSGCAWSADIAARVADLLDRMQTRSPYSQS